jgi:maleylpyruvate isomerase
MTDLRLYGYWRSTAAYRVRLALALKQLDFDLVAINLVAGEQRGEAYLEVNPQGRVPSLEVDGQRLTQSTAIIEWIEETYPDPPLLPSDPLERAHCRAIAGIVACDVHPLNNLAVLNRLRQQFSAGEADISAWIAEWVIMAFTAVEALLPDDGWACGARPGYADCFLIPQIYSARRFNVDMDAFTKLRRIEAKAETHPAFMAAHPARQSDAAPTTPR